MSKAWTVRDKDILLTVKVVPGASKNSIALGEDGIFRIRIAAAPEDGKANTALIKYLAKTLDCRRREINILSGERARNKNFSLPLSAEEALKKVLRELS